MRDRTLAKRIRALKEARRSDAEVAKELGLSERQVFRIRKEFGIGALKGVRPEVARATARSYYIKMKRLTTREVDELYKAIGRRYNDDDVHEESSANPVFVPPPPTTSYFGGCALACAEAS